MVVTEEDKAAKALNLTVIFTKRNIVDRQPEMVVAIEYSGI